MDCGIDCVRRYAHRLCCSSCTRRAHEILTSGRLAVGSESAPGAKARTRSIGYDPIESDFIHARHPEGKYSVD